jgi:2-keto-3-deoxy-L-rhamnonate aldolase RhmA
MKYGPEGKRGVALGVAHDRYRAGAVAEKLKAANEKTTLFCQIETAEGVKNADEMAAIDGVDCLWVGHFDLSSSLGVPGQFQHPTFLKAIDKVANATASTGNRSAGWSPMSQPASNTTTSGASTSSAIRATSGYCTTRCRTR